MTLNQFYGLIRDAVRDYPETEESYQRLQTFAVLNSISDLSADNLGHSILSKDTNYFYSRRWEAAKYSANNVVYFPPLVYVLPISYTFDQPFKLRTYQDVTMEIGVLYPNIEKIEDGLSRICTRIHRQDIYELAAGWMDYLFEYLSKAVFAQTDVDLQEKWYNRDQLNTYVDEAVISSYTVTLGVTNRFQSDLKAANGNAAGQIVDNFGKDNYCGLVYSIRVPSLYCRGVSVGGQSATVLDGVLIDDTGAPAIEDL